MLTVTVLIHFQTDSHDFFLAKHNVLISRWNSVIYFDCSMLFFLLYKISLFYICLNETFLHNQTYEMYPSNFLFKDNILYSLVSNVCTYEQAYFKAFKLVKQFSDSLIQQIMFGFKQQKQLKLNNKSVPSFQVFFFLLKLAQYKAIS